LASHRHAKIIETIQNPGDAADPASAGRANRTRKTTMTFLSKSRILAWRQCPKRLWLEVHHPELRQDSEATQASFAVGHAVGDIARRLYDPEGTGIELDPKAEGYDAAVARTAALLAVPRPIFEAGFSFDGVRAFADVMLPVTAGDPTAWRMVEVKSSTGVKDYHREDVAVQAYVARSSGTPLQAVALAHIDSTWTYPGGGDYQGLLVEEDLTRKAFGRETEVRNWIAEAQATASRKDAPDIRTGRQCSSPFECGFLAHCSAGDTQAEYPVRWLPRIQKRDLKALIEEEGVTDMRDVPDELLNPKQLRVKTHTLAGTVFFDAAGAASDLAGHELPVYFLDFETIMFAVPIWKGTRPYQQIPFQFSVHRVTPDNAVEHEAFLDLSGSDPSEAIAHALVAACGDTGPVFAYNAGFERTRITELAERLPALGHELLAIRERIVDLLPVAEERYYHPSQQGSWSIKKVLPSIEPELAYENLEGVKEGGEAMNAYLEAIDPGLSEARKQEIGKQLLDYCCLDTIGLVCLWRVFTGRQEL
jgi:hypothetical protein